MSKIFINTNKITDIQELEITLIKNTIKAEIIRKEIKKLQELETYDQKTSIINPIVELREKLKQEEVDNNEYLYYYDDIKDIDIDTDEESLKQIIKDSLPSKENLNYFKIVSRIKAEIYKELIEFNSLAIDETDLDLLNEIKNYTLFFSKKLELINQIEQEKNIIQDEQTKNNIVFLETSSGNVYALDDLKNIDQEYYESFKELYMSIKNGTFKNVKKFSSNNNKNKKMCEVKGFKTRILFDRLDRNTYIILQMLVKKCDNDKGYKESIINRWSTYIGKKAKIIEQLKDEKYLLKNMEIDQEINDRLNKTSKKKGI